MKKKNEEQQINNEIIADMKMKLEEQEAYTEENVEKLYDSLSSIARSLEYKEKNINILLIVSVIAMMFSILGIFC